MIGQEIVFRNQVYELHRLYQIQKTLTGESGCKELDAYNFWKERLQSPVGPFTNLMHHAALGEGNLFRNLWAGSAEYRNQDQFNDCNISSRNEVDLTLRIGEDTSKKVNVKNCLTFPHCVIDLEASTNTVSQEDTKNASGLSYATPVSGSKQESQFYAQANQVSTYSVNKTIFHEIGSNSTLHGVKSCNEDSSFNLGYKHSNSVLSSNLTFSKGKSFASNESIGLRFDFDLNKVHSDDSFDLNDPADTCLLTHGPSSSLDKLKGMYSDEASCSYATSCEKINGDRLDKSSITCPRKIVTKENIADIRDVGIIEMLEEKVSLSQQCKSKTRLEDSNSNVIRYTTKLAEQMNKNSVEGNDLIEQAAELLLHFSSESSVNNQEYSTNAKSILMENGGGHRPQCSIDSYESLVLKLEETSVDDDCVSSKAFEVDEFDKKESGVMWRRGRRLKDFQKDILPNLVALSRHEIREDVGILEAVMRSREYKRMRSKVANGENRNTPKKCKRSRPHQRYS